jgi:hypothetical protein
MYTELPSTLDTMRSALVMRRDLYRILCIVHFCQARLEAAPYD